MIFIGVGKSNPTKKTITVELLSVMPTPAGFSVFMKNQDKTAVIFVDPSIGIVMPHPNKHHRPFTHESMLNLMDGFGISLKRACITRADQNIYFAKAIFEMENEISELKILELDIRSSDAIVLCVRAGIPLQIVSSVWDEMHDVSKDYAKLKADQKNNNMMDFVLS